MLTEKDFLGALLLLTGLQMVGRLLHTIVILPHHKTFVRHQSQCLTSLCGTNQSFFSLLNPLLVLTRMGLNDNSHPLFSFGTLKGPIPLLHVWSSYISALSGTFSKFCPFIFWACATRADIAFRVPTSCKHVNKRSGSITKRKGRRERKGPGILLDPNIWGCTVESRIEMKIPSFSFSPRLFSAHV